MDKLRKLQRYIPNLKKSSETSIFDPQSVFLNEQFRFLIQIRYINKYPRLVCQEGEKWVIQLAGKTLAAATIS